MVGRSRWKNGIASPAYVSAISIKAADPCHPPRDMGRTQGEI